MAGQGNRDGATTNLHLTEHYISRLLNKKGIHRKSFRLRLGIKSHQYYHKCMQNPAGELTINQLATIASALEKPLLEVLGMVLGQAPSTARKWYEESPPGTLK